MEPGLALTKEFLNLMNSDISVNMDYHRNTSFHFIVPGVLVLHE